MRFSCQTFDTPRNPDELDFGKLDFAASWNPDKLELDKLEIQISWKLKKLEVRKAGNCGISAGKNIVVFATKMGRLATKKLLSLYFLFRK